MRRLHFNLPVWCKGALLGLVLIFGSIVTGNSTPQATAAAFSEKEAVYKASN